MKKRVLAFILCVSVIISSFNLGVFAVENNDSTQQAFEYGQAIVKLKDGVSDFVIANDDEYTIDNYWNLGGNTLSADSNSQSYDAFLVKSDRLSTEQLMEKMQELDEVEYAEPNYICYATNVNDPRYSEQWGLKNNGTGSGYKKGVDTNVEALWNKGITGNSKYVVAVLDTGVDYNHSDLKDNMWHNPYQNQGLAGEYGYDFCNNDADPMDDYFHGTHCAGILGAVGNNGIGISGVAQDVSIMAVKFLNNAGSGSIANALSAYEYLAKAKDLGVNLIAINNSWGEMGESVASKALNQAIKTIGEKGVLSICSAGNDGKNNDINAYIPSGMDNDYIISVGNICGNGSMLSSSNYGKTTVDVMAPGTSILSTMPDNQYTTKTGTSMATPMITGGVVLANQYYNDSLTPLEIRNKIISAVNTSESSLANKSVSGGFVDFGKLIKEETRTLTSISIDSLPNKVEYNVGDSLDTTGLKVSAKYSDGTTETITGYNITGFNSTTAGSKIITISYNGKSATFNVTVKETGGGGGEDPTPTPEKKEAKSEEEVKSEISKGGNVEIKEDLTLKEELNVAKDSTISAGGNTVTVENGIKVQDGANLAVNNANIESKDGKTAITVNSGASATLENTTINGSKSDTGAIEVSGGATLVIKAGTNVTGNTKSDGETPCNTYIGENSVIDTSNLTQADSSNTKIGITTAVSPTEGNSVVISGANSENVSGCFVSDNENYEIVDSVAMTNDEVHYVALAVKGNTPEPTKNGWVNTNGRWQYYINGSYLTDWQSNIPGWVGQYFYFDKATGFAKSTWANDIPGWQGQWFYFNPSNCVMMKGWVYDGGTRFFYLDDNTGVMKTGWHFLNWSGGANWFYFDNNGICLTNTTTPDGYYVDANGVWR